MSEPTLPALLERALAARREGRLEDARRDLDTAVELARSIGDPRDRIAALKALGQIERDRRGIQARAFSHYREATDLCREIDDPRLLAHTVRHLGDLHLDAGRLDEADACYLEALELYRVLEDLDPLELANAIRPLALLREAQDAAAEARPLWEQALELYQRAGVGAGVEECRRHLAARP